MAASSKNNEPIISQTKRALHQWRWRIDDFKKIKQEKKTSPQFVLRDDETGTVGLCHLEASKGSLTSQQLYDNNSTLAVRLQYDELVPTTPGNSLESLGTRLTFSCHLFNTANVRCFSSSSRDNDEVCLFKLGSSGLVRKITYNEPFPAGFESSAVLIVELQVLGQQRQGATQVQDDVDGSLQLVADLSAMFRDGSSADVVLESDDGGRYPAHRVVLSARSAVFRAMFEHDTVEQSQPTVAIHDIDGPTLKHMLEYIYTGRWPATNGSVDDNDQPVRTNVIKDITNLLGAADMYALNDLKLTCQMKLIRSLDVDCVCDLMALADKYNCTVLGGAAIKFFQQNFAAVGQTPVWSKMVRSLWQHPSNDDDEDDAARRHPRNHEND